MIRIKLSTIAPTWPWIRQTPGSRGIWDNCQFFVDQDMAECDYWVVYGDLLKVEAVRCPLENTVFITGEPPSIKQYDPRFLRQFATVITFHRNVSHPNVIHTQPALPWHVGRREKNETNTAFTKNYDELKSMINVESKDRLISVISSNKAFTEGHRKRMAFVEYLCQHFGSRLDMFGRGLGPIEDKWDAIVRYKYHIVLENGSFRDYWTEKVADAFLGLSYPLYYGCPNLTDYFPKEAFTAIDINDFGASIAAIEKAIDGDFYENSLESLRQAKAMVLDRYNIFAVLSDFCGQRQSCGIPRHVVLKPEGVAHSGVAAALRALATKPHRLLARLSG